MRHSMISFVENNARIKSHLNSGLYTKDVIDEVVDRTGALLPEHITSLLMGFFRELLQEWSVNLCKITSQKIMCLAVVRAWARPM